jgi:hypothetical protein
MGKHKDCAACAAHEPCPAWDRAAYYDTDEDAERLQYTTEFDAIGEFFDELESEDLAQLLEGDGYENPLEVYAFERDAPPDDAWFKRTACTRTYDGPRLVAIVTEEREARGRAGRRRVMNEQNDPRTCLECGKWVGEERERLQVQACMECMPPIAPPPRTTDGARLVAELTGGVVVHAERSEDGAIRGTIANNTSEAVAPRVMVSSREPLGRLDGTYPDAPADPEDLATVTGGTVGYSNGGRTGIASKGTHPPIVTLCGSTRFRRAFEEATYRLTLEGWAVLSVAGWGSERGRDGDSRNRLTPRQKEELDALHMQKVAMSRRVHVLNVGGYIGESTTREIAHAFRLGIAITFAEEAPGNAWLEQHSHKLGAMIADDFKGRISEPAAVKKKPHPFARRFSR